MTPGAASMRTTRRIDVVVIGEDLVFAQRWFPGLLLQQVVSPIADGSVSTGAVATTLAVYGLAMLAVVAVFFKRHDVTA